MTLFSGFIKRTFRELLRLNIAKKMLLGYLPITLLTILIGSFALINLDKINKINENIIKTDINLMKSTEKMIENIFSQELFGSKYIILKTDDMKNLYFDRSDEFRNELHKIQEILVQKGIEANKLFALHDEYNQLFLEWFETNESGLPIKKDYEKKIIRKQKSLVEFIQTISSKAGIDQKAKTMQTSRIGTLSFRITAILCLLSIILGIVAVILITKNISGAIHRLIQGTTEISKGNFDHNFNLSRNDELADLSDSFQNMAYRLKRLEEMYLDASPLTHLPGGVAIDNVLKKRINSDSPIAFCAIDLDNFKAFNDRYGYARGNKLLVNIGRLVENATNLHGSNQDFTGHIGGDDFVVISTMNHYQNICNYIVTEFDKTISSFYNKKDIKNGYIIGKTRTGQIATFPIMTISIAVVTNEKRKFSHHIQVSEKAAELKEYVKSISGSLYIVDRRKRLSKNF